MTGLFKLSTGALLLCALASCFAADHFHGDATQYDNLFFASRRDAPTRPSIQDDKWRNYAIFGLVAWDKEQTLFAGTRLGETPPGARPMKMYVRTENSFVNIAASVGLGLVGGILAPLLFVPRTTEVTGWTEG